MSEATLVSVGDQVLFVKSYGAEPVATNVTKVTRTGRIEVSAKAGQYRPDGRESWRSISKWNSTAVYAMSRKDSLEREAAEYAARKREQNEREEQQAREEAARCQREMSEVQAAVGSLINAIVSRQDLPDGSRLYLVKLAVKPEYTERKKAFELLIIRCWNEDVTNYDRDVRDLVKKSMVKSAMTYCNGGTQFWSSCGTETHESDEAAIWNAARCCYRSW